MNSKARIPILTTAGAVGVVIAAAFAIPQVTGQSEDEAQADRLRTAVAPYTDTELWDTVVATVNGRDITEGRLDGTRSVTGSDLARKEVLDELIEYELLYDEAVRLGVVPSDSDVAANLEITRANTPSEAVQAAIDLASEAGTVITVEEYWTHPQVIEGTKKALAVGNARNALADTAGPDATVDERDAALESEIARLWAGAEIEILDPSLE